MRFFWCVPMYTYSSLALKSPPYVHVDAQIYRSIISFPSRRPKKKFCPARAFSRCPCGLASWPRPAACSHRCPWGPAERDIPAESGRCPVGCWRQPGGWVGRNGWVAMVRIYCQERRGPWTFTLCLMTAVNRATETIKRSNVPSYKVSENSTKWHQKGY